MLRATWRGLAAVAALTVALLVPGVASADLLSPGDVATAAYTRMDAETFARAPHLVKSDFERERVDGGATAQSSYRWPAPAPSPGFFSCDATGCAGYDGRAFGRADTAAGVLRAAATASLHVGNEPPDGYGLAGYIFSDGAAAIADTITLSKPAIVTLRGSIVGSLGGSADTEEQPEPDGEFDVSLLFTGPDLVCDIEWCEQERFGGVEEEYEAPIFNCPGADSVCGSTEPLPGSQSVSDTFDVSIALPAGTSYFNAEVLASIHFQVYGDGAGVERSSAHVNFANSITFEIVVPDDVAASSGSGLLPIVGGMTQAPDTTPPVVHAPADVARANDPAGCAAAVDPGSATATDDSGAATVSGERSDGLALGAAYPVGATTITWTATDAAGNTASAAQTVTVTDTEAPTVSAPGDVTRPNDPGSAAAAVAPGTATAGDNCGAAAVTGARSDGKALDAPFPVGVTTITWTATDAAGNTATATQLVTVADVEAPTITAPGAVVADATSPAGAVVSYAAAAVDNVGVASFSCGPASGSAFPIGATTVTCTARDAAGNAAGATFVVTVRGAADQLADLVGSLTLQSLKAKAQAAQASAAAGNSTAACNQLGALLNQVDALEGKKLTSAEAADIRQRVAAISGVLGC